MWCVSLTASIQTLQRWSRLEKTLVWKVNLRALLRGRGRAAEAWFAAEDDVGTVERTVKESGAGVFAARPAKVTSENESTNEIPIRLDD